MEQTTVTKLVAQRVRQLRLNRGWSAQRLADECARTGMVSLSRGTIAKIESGVRKSIGVDEIDVLAKVLNVTSAELLAPSTDWPAPTTVAVAEQARHVAADHDVPVLALLTELEELRGWLTGLELRRLTVVMSKALGPAIPLPQLNDVRDAWDAFVLLSDYGSGPDGIPPAVAFLDLLAAEVAGDVGATITRWVGEQTRRLRLGSALEKRRLAQTPIPDQLQLHLTIMIEPDMIDPERGVLAFWRQDDPLVWPPALSDVREVALDELEYQIDQVILETEELWAGQGIAASIDFLLPRTLLHLPVQRWCKEHESGQPRPLRYDYRLSIRSLERMRAKHWHRAWHARWNSMLDHPSAERLYYSESKDPHSIDAVLSDDHWVGLVMAKPPPAQPEPGAEPDELIAALRSGLPVIFWHPYAEPADLRELINWVLEGDSGFLDLLARRKQANSLAVPVDESLVHDLVVLWDDPKRVIVLDQPLAPHDLENRP